MMIRNRPMLRAALVGTALAAAIGLTATDALADSAVATFTLSQPDWQLNTYVMENNVYSSLYLQPDGNLVLYKEVNDVGVQALWASGTNGRGVTHLDWSASGYIKLLNSSGGIVCTIGALSPSPGGRAVIQDDGNFVFYNTSGQATWASGTYRFSQGNLNYCYTG